MRVVRASKSFDLSWGIPAIYGWGGCQETARSISGTNVPLTIFYIGDFDPSGLNIEQTAKRGVADFLKHEFGWMSGRFEKQVTWQRIGVTEKEYYSMPECARVPLKRGDPRTKDFKAE